VAFVFYLGGEKIGRQKEKQQGQLYANALYCKFGSIIIGKKNKSFRLKRLHENKIVPKSLKCPVSFRIRDGCSNAFMHFSGFPFCVEKNCFFVLNVFHRLQ